MTCMYVPTYGSDDAEVLAERTNTTELLKLPKAAVEQVEFESGYQSQIVISEMQRGVS